MVGFISLLFIVFLAAYEIMIVRSVWIAQTGEWWNIIKTLGVSVLVRALLIWILFTGYEDVFAGNDQTLFDMLFLLNIVSIVIEAGGLAIIYMMKKSFMPPQAEIDAVIKRLKAVGTTTVDKCPGCKQVVEPDWCCCPACGTNLPRFCASCKAPVDSIATACASCGAEIAKSIAIEKMIITMKENADLQALPETKSVRYARYAESLLKGGQVDEAIEAYKKAVQYTKFVRKQTNFLVRIGTIYMNTGKKEEAADHLNAALELDKEDVAGAKKVLEKLFTPVENDVSHALAEKDKAAKA
jgi:predicted amidophosphoribosyltransferase